MARAFFRWVGGPKQPVNERISRELLGVRFGGEVSHIGFTSDPDEQKVFRDSDEFETSTKAEFLAAGGSLDEETADEEPGSEDTPPAA